LAGVLDISTDRIVINDLTKGADGGTVVDMTILPDKNGKVTASQVYTLFQAALAAGSGTGTAFAGIKSSSVGLMCNGVFYAKAVSCPSPAVTPPPKSANLGGPIGGAVGGVVFVLGLVAIWYFFFRNRPSSPVTKFQAYANHAEMAVRS